MRARDLAADYPTVTLDSPALDAAHLLAHERLPGIVVKAADGVPIAVLPGSQVVRFVVPQYVQDDPGLARVYDEKTADAICTKLAGKSVRDVLPRKEYREVEVVDGSATVLEVAAVMARMHSPVVAVMDAGRMVGAITAAELLTVLLPPG